jgi:Zn-dependent peptidase ImmA (M78 family)
VQWRARLEGLGVLVLQINLTGETVSGFSIVEGMPAIVLNKSDHESRRVFTLFHEWAHLLLGEPGLCNVDEGRTTAQDEGVESYCNAFAAEVLVPLDALRESGLPDRLAAARGLPLGDAVREGQARFGVSRWVILIRLFMAQAIERDAFDRMVRAWNDEAAPPKRSGGRSRPHLQALQNLGFPYVSRVMAARESGEITDADAVDYLGLKLRWFHELEALIPDR